MDKKLYIRGKLGQYWYNFTEALVYALTVRPCPENLEYKIQSYDEGKQNKIYTYCRKDLKETKKPLFIYIHGGGWVSGITPMRNRYIANWAQKGFFTASIGYTWAPDKVYPAQLFEVFKAIDQILDSAEENNFDPQNIVIAGESAGGYYISYVANCFNDKSVLDGLGIDFKHFGKAKIKALVSICGCYDLQRLTDESKEQSEFPDMKMMVTTFLGKNLEDVRAYLKTDDAKYCSPKFSDEFPPTYAVWSTNDKLRFETFDLCAELDKLGVPNKQFKADGIIGNHAWAIMPIFKKSRICFEDAYEFVKEYIEK